LTDFWCYFIGYASIYVKPGVMNEPK